ncbi:hypothetical protein V0M98_37685 (plasmid) [Pseudomonas silesiensis]|uniref:hypothetical protein n=1 Tax=Pseudomonas silesiensis TaxID=1853130 RepID=UPI0030CD1984
MFGFLRRKTRWEKMYEDLNQYYKKSALPEKISTGLVINIINSDFSKEFGNIDNFLKSEKRDIDAFYLKMEKMLANGKTRVGTAFFHLWLSSKAFGDEKTHKKVSMIMIDLSRQAELVGC